VWFIILQSFDKQPLSPQPDDNSFNDWWESSVSRVDGQIKKGLNSIIINFCGLVNLESSQSACLMGLPQPEWCFVAH
jgi:hypothetical protein